MPVIKKGSKGEEVKTLQASLAQLGYDPGAVDGIFGAKTEKAVRAFQKASGLEVDGIAGQLTWRTMEESFTFTGASTDGC